jgi:hypothetical protein
MPHPSTALRQSWCDSVAILAWNLQNFFKQFQGKTRKPRWWTVLGHCEAIMDDLKADWQRWSPAERVSVWCLGLGLSGLVPALLLLGQS